MIRRKKDLIVFLMLALMSSIALAKPSLARLTNVQVDSSGNFTSPDLYHYMQALRYYNKGDKGTALIRFKFSAEFGNRKSIKFIGLMYLDGDGVPRDTVKGQAWLKLAASRGDSESIKVTKQYENNNSDLENALVKQTYDDLITHYGRTVVINNAYKYYRRFKFQTLDKPNSIKFQGRNVVLNEMRIMRLSRQIKDFYYETNQEMGDVIQGEIIIKE